MTSSVSSVDILPNRNFCPTCGVEVPRTDTSFFYPWCEDHRDGHMRPKLYDPETGEPWFVCAECGGGRDGATIDYLCAACRLSDQ